jgi:hypothetical protein
MAAAFASSKRFLSRLGARLVRSTLLRTEILPLLAEDLTDLACCDWLDVWLLGEMP